MQAFAAALVSPHGANLGRINDEDNQLKTKAQLSRFIEDYITIVLTHGSAHLQVGNLVCADMAQAHLQVHGDGFVLRQQKLVRPAAARCFCKLNFNCGRYCRQCACCGSSVFEHCVCSRAVLTMLTLAWLYCCCRTTPCGC